MADRKSVLQAHEAISEIEALLSRWALFRGEHFLASFGLHPRALEAFDNLNSGGVGGTSQHTEWQREDAAVLEQDTATFEAINSRLTEGNSAETFFVRQLTEELERCATSNGMPVLYRSTDFKTHDMRYLVGSDLFEAKERNPQMGVRGLGRLLIPHNAQLLRWELEACRRAAENGVQLGILFPCVRRPDELTQALCEVDGAGVQAAAAGMMIELPTNVFNAVHFAAALRTWCDEQSAFPLFVLGLADLTQSMLRADRDSTNPKLQRLASPMPESLQRAIGVAIGTANQSGICLGVRRSALRALVDDNPSFSISVALMVGVLLDDYYVEPR